MTYRCDTCAAIAQQTPTDTASLLIWLAPPLELVEAMERWKAAKPLPQAIIDYLSRWQALRTAEPVGVPMVDAPDWI